MGGIAHVPAEVVIRATIQQELDRIAHVIMTQPFCAPGFAGLIASAPTITEAREMLAGTYPDLGREPQTGTEVMARWQVTKRPRRAT